MITTTATTSMLFEIKKILNKIDYIAKIKYKINHLYFFIKWNNMTKL